MEVDHFSTVLKQNLMYSCENTTNNSQLLDLLYNQDVITTAEAEEIQTQSSPYAKNLTLYMTLLKKIQTQESLELLHNALTKSGNNHILRMLLKAQDLKSDDPTLTNMRKIHFKVHDPIQTFMGRGTFTEEIHAEITRKMNESQTSRPFVVNGLGGIGKTETVRKYIHRYGQDYDHVVWLNAESSYSLENQFQKLAAQELGISSTDEDKDGKQESFQDLLTKVYTKLCANSCVPLIIFDNAQSLDNSDYHKDGIQRFLPQLPFLSGSQPMILITSRSRNWKLECDSVMELGIWTEYESREFVLQQLELKPNAKNNHDADLLCQMLDRFPMLIQAAVAVFEREKRKHLFQNKSYSLQDFISDYQNKKTDIFNQSSRESSHKITMSQVWSSTIEQIQKHGEGELAIRILNLLPYLHPTSIPQELIMVLLAVERKCFSKALNLLHNYSFIECSIDNKETFSTHSITQSAHLVHLKLMDGKEKQILLRMTRKFKMFWISLPYPSKLYENVTQHILYFAQYLKENFNDTFMEFTRFVESKILTTVSKEENTNDTERFEKTMLHEIHHYSSQEPLPIFASLTLFPKRSARQKSARKVNLKKAKNGELRISQGFQGALKEASEAGNTISQEFLNYIY